MNQNSSPNFAIRQFVPNDTNRVIFIWEQCDLVRNWNNPNFDIQRKLNFQKELFFVGLFNDEIIATAMFGYDGHRGWLNYFAVLPNFQKRGFGRQLMTYGEMALIERGCPKLNLQIRNDNTKAINFYQKVGYKEDAAVSFGKRLIED
ncbi:MAG: GNAT family acetyltransferase [Rhodobacterales bacterium]|jgi:ribosomal protein S18 acetylase RimI-like enzyme|nr:GNAT family acetyltransferase [Flavobacteriaceae bacterium]MBT4134338.1 GNAT family acetyltransferase [Rhodobacterales bacterium]MBT4322426.1 GNAT family acetyltransferase [Rhodobacterales bacterium]MBT6008602.1 GNAT family acetyltransferase [Rhodobacterales bacterium]